MHCKLWCQVAGVRGEHLYVAGDTCTGQCCGGHTMRYTLHLHKTAKWTLLLAAVVVLARLLRSTLLPLHTR